jgi:fibrillarin-like pre-rRNA processing protein
MNKFNGVFVEGRRIYTRDLISGKPSEWDPRRSKLAAAIAKGISEIGIKEGNAVLYLGASSGTTASHVSDIVGKNGFVFALDSSPRMVRDLVFECERKMNMAPLLEDANHPERYESNVTKVDVVYQDISQRNQPEIFLKNCRAFLKKGGFGILAVKARSVDVTKKPAEIFEMARKELEKEMEIVDSRVLEPFEKAHIMFVCRNKKSI